MWKTTKHPSDTGQSWVIRDREGKIFRGFIEGVPSFIYSAYLSRHTRGFIYFFSAGDAKRQLSFFKKTYPGKFAGYKIARVRKKGE